MLGTSCPSPEQHRHWNPSVAFFSITRIGFAPTERPPKPQFLQLNAASRAVVRDASTQISGQQQVAAVGVSESRGTHKSSVQVYGIPGEDGRPGFRTRPLGCHHWDLAVKLSTWIFT